MGTYYAPRIAYLFLYCCKRDFMSDLHKSKRHDLIYIISDTFRYLDDIFTIDTLNLKNKFLIYIQQNFSLIKQVILQIKKLLS